MCRHRGLVVLALSTLIAGLGCGDGGEARRPARPAASVDGRTTATSAASASVPAATPVTAVRAPLRVDTPSALVRMAAARCEREVACEHVGTGRAFGDRDERVNAIGHDVTAGLPVEADTASVEPSPSCGVDLMCARP